jgi:hypothetical protein
MKNKYSHMKTKYLIAGLFAILVGMVGCDKGFEDVNKDPLSPTNLDPAYLMASTQDMAGDWWHYEACILQQINLIITGQEDAGAHNIRKEGMTGNRWNAAYGELKTLTDVIMKTKEDAARTNLYNMARILRAWNYMILVDTYGDVPYTDAIQGFYKGNFFPKYDNQQDIYSDIEKELIEATDALDSSADVVKNEMYFEGNIAKWKKFGNSLLLRLGMRYSKLDPTKAQSIVQTATNPARGGVIETNADNVIIPYNATQTNPAPGLMNASTKQNWHIGRPFVEFLRSNSDPRMRYWVCLYSDPNSVSGGVRNSNPADQIGAPYGFDPATISQDPIYPGELSSSIWKYSMPVRQTCGRVDSWSQMVNAAQTQLLMAEARQRGWINTSTAKAYYDNAVTQALSMKDIYSTTRGGDSPITAAEITAYLAQPNISFNGADMATALKQINTQYWVASFMNWHEGWCNFRRSGYPQLSPINYPGQDPAVTQADGFIHRFTYPDSETNFNKKNVTDAATSIGGDNLGTRVFWDKQ